MALGAAARAAGLGGRAAALAWRALAEYAPCGEAGERQHCGEDDYRGGVHSATSFRAGLATIQRQKRSSAIATAVQNPKEPVTASSPIW